MLQMTFINVKICWNKLTKIYFILVLLVNIVNTYIMHYFACAKIHFNHNLYIYLSLIRSGSH